MGGLFVRELPAPERPRERLVSSGPSSLSDRELLAIILLSGGADESVLALSGRLLAQFDGRLRRLFNADIQELLSVDGIGMAKACQLKAVGELARRQDLSEATDTIVSPRDAAMRLMPRMRDLDRERLVVLPLDVKNHLIDGSEIVVSVGSLDGSPVRPRDVFRIALLKNAASIFQNSAPQERRLDRSRAQSPVRGPGAERFRRRGHETHRLGRRGTGDTASRPRRHRRRPLRQPEGQRPVLIRP